MSFKRLTDAEWELVEICMPEQHRGRPRFVSDRACLDALLYILSTGCRWTGRQNQGQQNKCAI